jgi:hypothetical protein
LETWLRSTPKSTSFDAESPIGRKQVFGLFSITLEKYAEFYWCVEPLIVGAGLNSQSNSQNKTSVRLQACKRPL